MLYADRIEPYSSGSTSNSQNKKRSSGSSYKYTEVTKRFKDALHEFINRERSTCFELDD